MQFTLLTYFPWLNSVMKKHLNAGSDFIKFLKIEKRKGRKKLQMDEETNPD